MADILWLLQLAAFSRHIRTEKGKPGSGAASEAALQAARLRKFQAEAILRTIAAAERSGEVVPLRGVRDMLSRMIHRCRAKLLTIPGRLSREFGGEVSELAEVLLEEALCELRRLSRDDFMPGRARKQRNGATEHPISTELEDVLAGWQGRLADAFGEVARRRFALPSRQTVDQWAQAHRYLPETAAEPGKWNPHRAPYQSGIMQAFTLPAVRTITIQSASQVGKSTIMTNCLGYVIDRMPAASLWLMPSLQAATDYMKEVVRPMLEASPSLLAKIRRKGPPNYRRILFEGGYCVFSGGASAINLASRAIKILFCDEIGKLRYAIKNEGDPLSLILKRLSTYADSKALFASTPTVSAGSRIERLFQESSMSWWFLKCPSGECDGWQESVWEDLDFDTICVKCQNCGGLFTQGEWQRSPGEWRESVPNPTHKGFFISGLCSPWTDWGDLIREFLAANRQAQMGDLGLLQSWRTGRLGLPWEEKVETTRAEDLWARREVYECDNT